MKYFEKLRQLGVSPVNFDDVDDHCESKLKTSNLKQNSITKKNRRNSSLNYRSHKPIKLNCRIGRVYPVPFFVQQQFLLKKHLDKNNE